MTHRYRLSRTAFNAMRTAEHDVCPSGKVRYRTKRKALVAIEALRSEHTPFTSGAEKRSYWCSHCAGWHLTSQGRRAA